MFSTSRFVPSALSSGFLATFPLLCFTLHLLFANFFILLTYFSSTCPVLCFTFSYVFITFFRTFSFCPLFFAKLKYIFKKSKVQIFLLARAFNREHFLVTMLKKEVSTAKELNLRLLGKVIIFVTNRQTEPSYYI